jgi:hypothetical protein
MFTGIGKDQWLKCDKEQILKEEIGKLSYNKV